MASLVYTKGLTLIGSKVGRWFVLSIHRGKTHYFAACTCDCGTRKSVRVDKLLKGKSKSCGCLRNENLTTHGMTKRSIRAKSREYWIWNTMKQRCSNPKYKQYPEYGGRGITVCERWKLFDNFFEDMGLSPDGFSVERLDNDKGYSPDNCCWADRQTQNSNKRNNRYFTLDGVTDTLAGWARKTGVSHSTILARLDTGWAKRDALTAPKWSRHAK